MSTDRELKLWTGPAAADRVVADIARSGLGVSLWVDVTATDDFATTLTWEQARDLGEWLVEEAARHGFPRDELLHRTE